MVELVIITGPSGAGSSTALNIFQDFGWETIDNTPMSLVAQLFDGVDLESSMAISIDVRNRDFSSDTLQILADRLRIELNFPVYLLYLDADMGTLMARYNATRRPHPLAKGGALEKGILEERTLLQSLKTLADIVIDSSDLSPQMLREQIAKQFNLSDSNQMMITVSSFSYKKGLPDDSDLVFDCRILNNPHWEDKLRGKTGLDGPVQEFVTKDSNYRQFVSNVALICDQIAPIYKADGKAYFNIAFGCTGGQHRSVTLAEMFGDGMKSKDWNVRIKHRELDAHCQSNRGGDQA